MVVDVMNLKAYIRPADWVLIAFLLVTAVLSFFLIPRWLMSGATEVEILAGDRLVGRYPLNHDQRIEVPGPLGVSEIVIEGGHVRFQSSPCPHKTCKAMGNLGTEGGILVCLPNEIVVRVGNGQPDGLDAVSR
jgi:hypothetical protein